MDLIVAEKIAINLMERYGLRSINNYWILKFSNAKMNCGVCNSTRKYIKLASLYVIHSSEQDVKDTILHEIAHAIVGTENHHNHIWKNKCFEIGAVPKRSHKDHQLLPGPYEIWCPKCGLIAYKYRKFNTERKRICLKCKSIVKIKINENFLPK